MIAAAPAALADRFAAPADLAKQGYGLRPETDDDTAFLRVLYATTRARELALLPWTAAQKTAFTDQQFEAQRFHYRKFFPGTAFDVIEHLGAPVGRIYTDIRPTHVHLIDIALLPGTQGQGLGTAFITALQVFARERSKGLALCVEASNPAQRLYRRLGFSPTGESGVHIEMEWLPERGTA